MNAETLVRHGVLPQHRVESTNAMAKRKVKQSASKIKTAAVRVEHPGRTVDVVVEEKTKPSLSDKIAAIRKSVEDLEFDAIPKSNWENLKIEKIPNPGVIAPDAAVILYLLRRMVAHHDLKQEMPVALMREVRLAIAMANEAEGIS